MGSYNTPGQLIFLSMQVTADKATEGAKVAKEWLDELHAFWRALPGSDLTASCALLLFIWEGSNEAKVMIELEM